VHGLNARKKGLNYYVLPEISRGLGKLLIVGEERKEGESYAVGKRYEPKGRDGERSTKQGNMPPPTREKNRIYRWLKKSKQ